MFSDHRRLLTAALAALAVTLGSLLFIPSAHAAGTVSGVVKSKLAAGSAVPYEGASIEFSRLLEDGRYDYDNATYVSSGPTGAFTAPGLADGDYQVRVHPSSWGSPGDLGYEYYDNAWSPYEKTDVQVRGGNVTMNDIVLEQPGWVVGTVKDAAGNPIVGASISVQKTPTSGGYGFEIDPDGSYDTRDGDYTKNLIPGSYTVEASGPWTGAEGRSFRTKTATVNVPANAAAAPQNFVLEERKKVVFTVTDSTGAPMQRARVDMRIQRNAGDPFEAPQYGPIETDDDGKFAVDDDAHAYKLRFFPADAYTGSNAAEWWNGGDGAYTYAEATAIDFPASAPMKRSLSVQLATPAITPGEVSIDGDIEHMVEDPHGNYTVNAVRLGQTITANPGTWAPSGVTLSYQWHKNGQPIAGATDPELTITEAIAADMWLLRLHVTGSKPGEQAVEAESEYINDPVLPGDPPVAFARPAITGTAQVGKTLTAVPGTWGPAGVSLAYQWFAAGEAIQGATNATLALTDAQLDKAISVRVTGSLAGHTSVARTSAATTATTPVDVVVGTPTITGTAKAGSTLTANPGAWTPGDVTFAYTWLADGVAISGAGGTTLDLTNAQAGKRISVEVTGSRGTSAPRTATSAQTSAVQGTLTAATPTITGTAKAGEELTASPGAWGPAGVALSYEWLAGGQHIVGATGATYTPGAAQVGKAITVRVTGTLAGYGNEVRTSAATAAVIPGDITAGTPSISGTPAPGRTLTANPGTWTPADAELSYQWLANGTPLVGATGTTLVVSNAHAGKRLSVTVTGTTSTGAVAEATSSATATVVGVLKGATPKVSGKAKVGKRLSAKPGTWSPAPVRLTYQWLRNGKVIKGATKASYKLTKADAGKRIQVRVTGRKTSYKTLVKSSAKTAKVKR